MRAKILIALWLSAGYRTAGQVGRSVGSSQQVAYYHLSKLYQEGYVEAIRETYKNTYRVKYKLLPSSAEIVRVAIAFIGLQNA